MYNFILDIFINVAGVGAASGIFYKEDTIYLISDNSNYLYSLSIPENSLSKTLLVENKEVNEAVPKSSKMDLESLFNYQDTLYLLGSGSKLGRNNLFKVALEDQSITSTDLSESYAMIQKELNIDTENYNIEGAFIYNDQFHLLNRGNGPDKMNGIISVSKSFDGQPSYKKIDLQTASGENPMFTDAVLDGDTLYFIAAAEESNSTYEDGEVTGSFIGQIDLKNMNVNSLTKISDTHKFEGITLYRSSADHLEFLLCEDPDNDQQETTIYKLKVAK